jgi:hypothetical protein
MAYYRSPGQERFENYLEFLVKTTVVEVVGELPSLDTNLLKVAV